jgi:RNA polymerase sigma factor (sigma-70 family)
MRTKAEQFEEDVLIKYNKLIMKLSLKTFKSYNGKYSLDDIVQEAKIGAIKAVRNYDPTKNVKLITHLYNYINFYLSHFTRDDTGLIKIPKTTKVESNLLPEIIDAEVFQSNFVNERGTFSYDIEKNIENKLFIEECFASLNNKEKEILKLVFLEGYTYNQVADMYNVSRQYANLIANKAINKLKEKYIEFV